MKKSHSILVASVMASVMVFSVTACSNKSTSTQATKAASTKTKWASTSETFDPLTVKDAISFDKMRSKFGAIPKVAQKLAIAGNVKAFENVVWREMSNGYVGLSKEAQKAGINLNVDTKSPLGETDDQGQLTILQNQVREHVNAILLSPITDANCIPGVEAAHEANIPVYAINNEFNGADRFIGPNSLEQGQIAAKWVNDKLSGAGKVAIVQGIPTTGVARNRTKGFADWFAANGSSIKVVETQNADWDETEAHDLAATWLKVHPDLKAIFCNNDVMALGVVEAIKQTGLKLNKDIYVIGCDGTDEAINSIKKGEMAATINTFPYYEGFMGAEISLRVLAGQNIPRVVWTPSKMLDATNINEPAVKLLNWTDPTFK